MDERKFLALAVDLTQLAAQYPPSGLVPRKRRSSADAVLARPQDIKSLFLPFNLNANRYRRQSRAVLKE